MENKEKVSPFRKILTIVSWMLTGVLGVLSILLVIFGISSIRQGKMMKFFGYSYSVVVSESMEPVINVNDIIFINCNYDFDNIEKGDIVVFYNPHENKNITHRVHNVLPDGSLETLGDNNHGLVDDFHVTNEYYIGKVIKYGRYLGIGSFISNGRAVFFIALIAIFVYVIVAEVINIYRAYQLEKHKENMEKIKEEKAKQEEELRRQLKEELRKELMMKKDE